MQRKTHAGYTLIELLVVIALTVLLLIGGTSIFFTTLVGGGKTAAAEYVKQSGQHAMNQITFLIRNSRKLTLNSDLSPVVCQTAMSSVGLLNYDTGTTYIKKEMDGNGKERIASNSGSYLTPDDLTISSGPTFDCSPSSYGTSSWNGAAPTVTVRFTLRKGTPSVDKARDIVEIPFESSITLRNF